MVESWIPDYRNARHGGTDNYQLCALIHVHVLLLRYGIRARSCTHLLVPFNLGSYGHTVQPKGIYIIWLKYSQIEQLSTKL